MAFFTAKRIRIIKTCNLYCSFFVIGLCVAVPGPTLIDLTNIVNTDIKTIAYIFTARSAGYLTGSLAGGILFDMVARKQFILFISNLMIAVTMIGLPWSRQILTLAVWMVLNGITLGVLDTGGNVCCLNLWGKDSGPFYQALHFTFGIGGLIAPLIAAPFLGTYSDIVNSDSNNTFLTNFTDLSYFNESENGNFISLTSLQIPPVTYTYSIIGVCSFLVSILFLVMCIVAPIDEGARKAEESGDTRKSVAFTALIVVLICILILTSMGTEVGYAQMLTTYAVKGPLHLSTTTGSFMTSTYWGSFTTSRLAAIFLAIKFSNLSILMFDVVLTFVGSLILMFLAVYYEWALWLASVVLGVGIASFFPASVSWIERYITITNKMASLFAIGAAFGEMVIPYTISHFIDEKPEVFIYVSIISSAIAIIVTLTLYLILRKVPDKYTARKGTSNAAFNAESHM